MKIKILTAILGVYSLFSIVGCSKDDNNNSSSTPTPVTPTASMTATVQGTAWSALTSKVSASIVNNTTNITGIASDSTTITITVTTAVTVGTYDLGAGGQGAAVYMLTPSGTSSAWSSNSGLGGSNGSITITALDATNKRISGTFHFVAYRASDGTTKSVTNGVFTDVTYTTSISGGGGSSSLACKVDGVNFNAAITSGTVSVIGLQLVGSDSQGSKSIGLIMPETVTPGTYTIGTFGDTYAAQYNPNSSTFTASTSGTLVITSHNTSTKKIIGTFTFDAEPFPGGAPPTYHITNGTFNITYQ